MTNEERTGNEELREELDRLSMDAAVWREDPATAAQAVGVDVAVHRIRPLLDNPSGSSVDCVGCKSVSRGRFPWFDPACPVHGSAALAATPTQTGAEGPADRDRIEAIVAPALSAAFSFTEAAAIDGLTKVTIEQLAALRSGAEVAAAPGLSDALSNKTLLARCLGNYTVREWRALPSEARGGWLENAADVQRAVDLYARLTAKP